MRRVFADTSYFIALFTEKDEAHARAIDFSQSFEGQLITTQWVIVELADTFSRPGSRALVARIINDMKQDLSIHIVPLQDNDLEAGLALFESRQDKSWSLTDCISFEVMNHMDLKEAATGDHHFEQAGFVALLK